MAGHLQITAATGIPVYFCEPRSPWQRGTNENSNGLLRDYFPTATNLAVHSAERLAHVQDELNNRPRKTAGGNPELPPWPSYSRRVHEPLLRRSLESARTTLSCSRR